MREMIAVSAVTEGYWIDRVLVDDNDRIIQVLNGLKHVSTIQSADDWARRKARHLGLPLYNVEEEKR